MDCFYIWHLFLFTLFTIFKPEQTKNQELFDDIEKFERSAVEATLYSSGIEFKDIGLNIGENRSSSSSGNSSSRSRNSNNDNDNVIVPCPICSMKKLQLNFNILFCECGFRLDTQNDSISLQYVKSQIEETLRQHNMNCQYQPIFHYINNLGGNSLLLLCNICDCFTIVI